MDAGLSFNFPLVPLLQPSREVDVIVLVDFTPYDPTTDSLSLSPDWINSNGGSPSSLSLSACSRIVEEHGGRTTAAEILDALPKRKPAQ